MLHKCHQTFPCASLWHSGDKFTCWSLSHRFIYIMLCTHSLLPNPATPIFSALFLRAIKHLHCLSPVALLSTAFSAMAELEKNRVFQVRMCIRLYKGIYRFFCYFLTQLNILFAAFFFDYCKALSEVSAATYFQVKLKTWQSNNPAV